MLKLNNSKNELKLILKSFIWDFKVGDNIIYNLDVLFELIDDYNESKRNYGKPISIVAISIIEAIMVDLIYRLYSATNHFPECLSRQKDEIKSKLKEQTTKAKFETLDGQEAIYFKLKNFNFAPMVEVYKELKLLGANDKNYDYVLRLSQFRNRLHINNYFNNFEKDEEITFSKGRVQKTLNAMEWFFAYFFDKYKRPWR